MNRSDSTRVKARPSQGGKTAPEASQTKLWNKVTARIPRIKIKPLEEHLPDENKTVWVEMLSSVTRIPTFNYYALWGVVVALSVIGLVMQFSAMTILELSAGNSPYDGIVKPLGIMLLGFLGTYVLSRIRLNTYHRFAGMIFLCGLFAQVLVKTPLGRTANGNTNWIVVPGTNQVLQPSEFLKISFIIFLSMIFAQRRCDVRNKGSFAFWIIGSFGLCAIFVMLGKDMGTMLIFLGIAFCATFIAGASRRALFYCLLGVLGIGVIGVLISASRRKRLLGFFNGQDADPMGVGLQPLRAKWGLGTGGLTGVGPGASRQKWNYLPEAHTDFILAIIGEEFGLIGTLTVLCLFMFFTFLLIRLIIQSRNTATRICAAGTIGWIILQAVTNILVVIGLLPVIGVPLPLVSSGGSSQLATLFMTGVLLAHIKAEPGMAELLERPVRGGRKTFASRVGVKR